MLELQAFNRGERARVADCGAAPATSTMLRCHAERRAPRPITTATSEINKSNDLATAPRANLIRHDDTRRISTNATTDEDVTPAVLA